MRGNLWCKVAIWWPPKVMGFGLREAWVKGLREVKGYTFRLVSCCTQYPNSI